ncbi:MAG: type I secretion system permease/ATPase [Burkholderiales bacterium]
MKKPGYVSFGRGELSATLWSFRREFLIVALLSMVTNILMLSPTLYMLQIFDRVVVSQSTLTLLAVSLITLFLFVLMALAEWARSRQLVRAGVRLDQALNTRVFRACFEAALSGTERNPGKAFADLNHIRQFLTGNGVFAIFDAPWTPIYLVVMYLLHPMLGWVALGFSLMLAAITWLGHFATRRATAAALEHDAKVNAYVFGKLRNAEVIEALGMLDNLRHRWSVLHNHQLFVGMRSQEPQLRLQSFTKVVRYSQQSLMLGLGALLVIDGELSVGAMIAGNVLMSRALAPIDLLGASWKSFITARKAFVDLNLLLGANPLRAASVTHDTPTGQVQIQNLIATVLGRAQPILRGLNAAFPAGESVAIIGPSGSGKSTLARVLVGIWPHLEGQVLLDGQAIESWDRAELGPHIGYLPQDVELLEGTIAQNISRFGKLDSQAVIDAAKRTGIHELILRFPAGYDTPMGEVGSLFSGGHRQRIGLARAIYGNPALVVLDEPDANLDEAGAVALVETLAQLKAMEKTVFVISHRMNMLAAVDRVLLLVNGEIRLYGPRAQVLAALKSSAQPQGPNAAAQPA